MKPAVLAVLGLLVLAPDASSIQRRSTPKPPAAPAAPQARRERPVPFHVGETLTYDVSWSSYLSAGTAVVSVKEKKPSFDSTAYYIVAEARPTPLLSKLYTLYYKLDTLLDAYTLLPQRGSVYSEEGKRHRFKTTRFDRRQQKVFFEYQSGTTVKADFGVPAFHAGRAVGDLRPAVDSAQSRGSHDDADHRRRRDLPVGNRRRRGRAHQDADGRGQRLEGEARAHRRQGPVGRQESGGLDFGRARRYPVKIQAELAVGSFNLLLREAAPQ